RDPFVFRDIISDPVNGGEDILSGSDGFDIVLGGPGRDKIFGGNNNDVLLGDNGEVLADQRGLVQTIQTIALPPNNINWDDSIQGDQGSDVILGGVGSDIISGGADS